MNRQEDVIEFEEVGRFITAHPVNLSQGRADLVRLFAECGTKRPWILCINKRGDRCNAIHRDGHRFRFYGEAYGGVALSFKEYREHT